MKITMKGVLNIPVEVEQILCRPDQIQQRESSWNRRGYELYEVRSIDKYTTLMRFYNPDKQPHVTE